MDSWQIQKNSGQILLQNNVGKEMVKTNSHTTFFGVNFFVQNFLNLSLICHESFFNVKSLNLFWICQECILNMNVFLIIAYVLS